jgi:hypothetical protein
VLAAVLVSGCGKEEYSAKVEMSGRQGTVKVTGEDYELSSTLGFALTATTTSASELPKGEPVTVEVEVEKAEVNGEVVPLLLSAGKSFSVDPSGHKGTWVTHLPSANVEVTGTAKMDKPKAELKCDTKVPFQVRAKYRVVPGGKWKLVGGDSGPMALHNAEAFIDCPKPAAEPEK